MMHITVKINYLKINKFCLVKLYYIYRFYVGSICLDILRAASLKITVKISIIY